MKWSSWLLGSLAAAALTGGCGGERRSDDAGAAGTGTETGTMQGDSGITSDTARDTTSRNPGDIRPSDDTTVNPSQ